MNITFTQHGDYYLPNLTLPEQEFSIASMVNLDWILLKNIGKVFIPT